MGFPKITSILSPILPCSVCTSQRTVASQCTLWRHYPHVYKQNWVECINEGHRVKPITSISAAFGRPTTSPLSVIDSVGANCSWQTFYSRLGSTVPLRYTTLFPKDLKVVHLTRKPNSIKAMIINVKVTFAIGHRHLYFLVQKTRKEHGFLSVKTRVSLPVGNI